MNVNAPIEDVPPAAAVEEEDPEAPPASFEYLRSGMFHNRYGLLHHGMHYALPLDKIALYEEVNDLSIVDTNPRTLCGIAGRGCSLLRWKEPRTLRRVLNEFGNVITHGRVGSFVCVLVNTRGEEVVIQCHDYVSVPNGTTVHSLQQILESPHDIHLHSFSCQAYGRHNCLTMNIHDGDVISPCTVALVGGARKQLYIRMPTIADWDEWSGLALSHTPLTSIEDTTRDGNDYAAPLELIEGTSDYIDGQSYHQLNGHAVVDPVTDGYDCTNIDTVGGPARTAPTALYTREARLAGINLAHVGSSGGYSAAVTALSTSELNGRTDCLPWYKVFLDSCATYHVSFVPGILTGLREAGSVLQGSCNAGATQSTRQGMLGGRFLMWFNPGGIANLLSIPLLQQEGYVIRFQSDAGGWVVTTPGPNPITIPFTTDTVGVTAGMPYIDIRQRIEGIAMIQTVEHNMEGYTSREVREAYTAREAQARLGHPSTEQMRQLVSSNSLLNCPVTPQAITNAISIFGPDLGSLRGKSVRSSPDRVVVETVSVPDDYFRLNRFVTLVADVMFVNGLAFFVTRSLKIKLITTECVNNRTASELGKSLTKIVNIYARGGFTVRCALMDQEFDKIKDKMNTVTVNTTAAREHVPEVERVIRDIKNRARAVLSVLPYDYYHRQIIIYLVYFVVRMINAVPSKVGISKILSPSEIVQGRKIDYRVHCRFPFGAYVEASSDNVITNTMEPRTEPCIAIGTSGNIQGSVNCLCLRSGRVLVRRSLKELPFPPSILKLVELWGKIPRSREYQRSLVVLDRHKRPVSDDGDDVPPSPLAPKKVHPDSYFEPPGVTVADATDDDAAIHIAPLPSLHDRVAQARVSFNLPSDTTPAALPPPHRLHPVPEQSASTTDSLDDEASTGSNGEDEDESTVHISENGDVSEDDSQEPDITTLPTSRQRNAPSQYTPSFNNKTYDQPGTVNFTYQGEPYKALQDGIMLLNVKEDADGRTPTPMNEDEIETHVIGIALVEQYSLKKASKLFGATSTDEAVSKELNQIHDMETYTPLDPTSLSGHEKKQALNALLFLTEKRDGTIKARKCADGSKQRFNEGYVKSDGSAPTVSTDSVMITCAIEASNHCDVATIDLPGAFLHTDNDEDTIMLLRGKLAELLVQIDPTIYRKYVTTSAKGEPLLYVRLQKAIYGLLRSALLFYRKLAQQLIDFGFEINPYDPCVATKMVPTDSHTELAARAIHHRFAPKDGSQPLVIEPAYCQIATWHVDDLKLSHIDPRVNDAFIEHFKNLYNRDSLKPVTITRGKTHDYLGIDLDYTHVGSVRISMIKYVDKIFNDFPEQVITTVPPSTPAANHLFDIRGDDDPLKHPLSEEQSGHFHRAVAQLLFLCMRSRRDIQTAVSFLTTRVRAPDDDDWNKLVRVLKYLYGTRHMKLKLSVHNMSTIKWWVDASYGTHWDCKGHTGMMMSLGEGAVLSSSRKQKLNTKSSTESELVGVDDVISKMMWGKYFIESLGYTVEHNILLQDNKSTILLAKNGKLSSSSKTKHIKHRYFLITDKIAQGDLEVVYEPTKQMWSDILTKPQQGQLFFDMRAKLMNIDSNYNDDIERYNTHPDLLPSSTAL